MFLIIPSEADYRAQARPSLTIAVLCGCALVFLMQIGAALNGNGVSFARGFGLIAGEPRWWTWFTSMWIHADLLHFLSNMAFLWIFGALMEDRLGKLEFAAMYLISGLVGNALQVALGSSAGALLPIVGASGAIAGCLGAALVLLPQTKIQLQYLGWLIVPLRGAFWVTTRSLLGVWIGLNLWQAWLSWGNDSVTGVATWCHIGGFVTGTLVAWGRRPQAEPAPVRIIDRDAIVGPFPVAALREMLAAGAIEPDSMVETLDGRWVILHHWLEGQSRGGRMPQKAWMAVGVLAVLSSLGAWVGTNRAVASGQIERTARGSQDADRIEGQELIQLGRKAAGPAKAWAEMSGRMQLIEKGEVFAMSNALNSVSRRLAEGGRNGWPSNSFSAYHESVKEAMATVKNLDARIQLLPAQYEESTKDLSSRSSLRRDQREQFLESISAYRQQLTTIRTALDALHAQCLVIDTYGARFNRRTRTWETRDPQGRAALQRAEADVQAKLRSLEASQ